MEELKRIMSALRKLEICGELRVIYLNNIGSNAMVMENTDKFVIAINPSLGYEQQIKELWHEAKHIYSHLNNPSCNVNYAEYDAEQFVNAIISRPENFEKIKNTYSL